MDTAWPWTKAVHQRADDQPGRRFRIGVLVEARYRAQAQPAGVAAALRARGHDVIVIDPESASVAVTDLGWYGRLDLLVCRGRSPAVLALLAAAERHGVRCLNSASSVAGVVNKADLGAALSAANLPVPPTFLGPPKQLAGDPMAPLPLILKPICGDNATGLRIVWSRRQLRDLRWPDAVALAQPFISTDGMDLKLYGAGDRVWAVRRASPIDQNSGRRLDHSAPSEPVEVTAELTDLANRCRDVTGLEFFGVDCVLGPDGPTVLEVNDFPNYTGVVGSDDALADHVLARIRG